VINTYKAINPSFGEPNSNYLILQVLRDFWKKFLLEKTSVIMSKFYVIVSGWDDQILISQLQDYLYDYLLTLVNYEHIPSKTDESQEG
jgi:hypothetical protein